MTTTISRVAIGHFGSVLLAASIGLHGPALDASAAATSACSTCNAKAVKRFLRSKAGLDCRPGTGDPNERLHRAVTRCAKRLQCTVTVEAAVAAVHDFVDSLEARICEPETGDVAPSDIRGPVGHSPAAVEPNGAASLGVVAAFCAAHPAHNAVPPLMALPEVSRLPDWCDEDDAYREFVDTCGQPRIAFVSQGADPTGADGSIQAPFPSITGALQACGPVCHLLVGPGLYTESPGVPSCTFIEGGVSIQGDIVVPGAPRPRIEGSISASGSSITLARLDVQDTYGALHSAGDILVSDAVLRGGYEGGSSAWQAQGPRICRSHIAAGYGGADIAWHSSRLWVAGSAVAGCYEGLALSWGSRDLRVLDSVVYGGYQAIGTSWGSVTVDVRGSRLASEHAAVDIHIAPDEDDVFPVTFDVRVVGNSIASGTLPESDPDLGIVVRDNHHE
jgi:hypothetical protein